MPPAITVAPPTQGWCLRCAGTRAPSSCRRTADAPSQSAGQTGRYAGGTDPESLALRPCGSGCPARRPLPCRTTVRTVLSAQTCQGGGRQHTPLASFHVLDLFNIHVHVCMGLLHCIEADSTLLQYHNVMHTLWRYCMIYYTRMCMGLLHCVCQYSMGLLHVQYMYIQCLALSPDSP